MPLAAVRRASAVGEKYHCLRPGGAGQNAWATSYDSPELLALSIGYLHLRGSDQHSLMRCAQSIAFMLMATGSTHVTRARISNSCWMVLVSEKEFLVEAKTCRRTREAGGKLE